MLLPQPGSAEPRWESIHYAPNRDRDGNVVGIYAVHGDIHDEKRNEEALRRVNWELSSHIGNTPLAVLEWDRDLHLVRWSEQARKIFGFESSEVLGLSLTDNPMLHEEESAGMVDVVGKLMTGLEPRAGRAHAQPPQGRRGPSGASGTTRRCSARTARSCRSCRSCRTSRRGSARKSACSTWRRATR